MSHDWCSFCKHPIYYLICTYFSMWIALAAPGGFLRFPENSQVHSANWNWNLICKSDLNTLIEQSTTLIEQSHLVVTFAWAKTIRCKNVIPKYWQPNDSYNPYNKQAYYVACSRFHNFLSTEIIYIWDFNTWFTLN